MALVFLTLSACPANDSVESRADLAIPPPLCDDSTVGTDAAVPASFANVQQIFNQSCIGCHCCGAYLQLFEGVSYQNLVSRPASTDDQSVDESCGGTLVVPADAGASYLYQKVSSQPCAGTQMPHAEILFVPLPVCEQDLIRRWIAAGAVAE